MRSVLFFLSLLCLVWMGVDAACSDHNTCGPCISESGCGWCAASSTCLAGDALKPANNVTCFNGTNTWGTTGGFQCPGTLCTAKACLECMSDINCGVCITGDTQTCINGGVNGPTTSSDCSSTAYTFGKREQCGCPIKSNKVCNGNGLCKADKTCYCDPNKFSGTNCETAVTKKSAASTIATQSPIAITIVFIIISMMLNN